MRYLPFYKRFHDPLLRGEKTHTTRRRKYGEPGDVVASPVGPLRIVSVQRVPLRVVRDDYWRQEAVASPEEFVKVWCQIHPAAGFQADERFYLHEVEPVREEKVRASSGGGS